MATAIHTTNMSNNQVKYATRAEKEKDKKKGLITGFFHGVKAGRPKKAPPAAAAVAATSNKKRPFDTSASAASNNNTKKT
mgnify:CR=1 FL=1